MQLGYMRPWTGRTCAAVVAGVVMALTPYVPMASAQDKIPIRAGAGSNIGFGPFFVLGDVELGIAAKYGLEWDQRVFASGAATMEAALAGQLDMTAFSPQVGMEKIATGDACLAGVVMWVDTSPVKMVGYNELNTAQDLVGKKVATLANAVGDLAFHLWLEQEGVPADKVTMVNVAPPDMPVALARHDVDAVVWVEPTMSQALEVTGADKVHYIGDIGEAFHDVEPLNLTCDWVRKYGDDGIKRVIHAWIDAAAYVKANPEKAAAITGKVLQLEPAQVLDLWKSGGWLDGATAWPANMTDDQIDMLTRIATFMASTDKLSKVPDFRNWIKPQWLVEVAPDRVQLEKHSNLLGP